MKNNADGDDGERGSIAEKVGDHGVFVLKQMGVAMLVPQHGIQRGNWGSLSRGWDWA